MKRRSQLSLSIPSLASGVSTSFSSFRIRQDWRYAVPFYDGEGIF